MTSTTTNKTVNMEVPLQIVVRNIPKTMTLIDAKKIFRAAGELSEFNPEILGEYTAEDGPYDFDWAVTMTAKSRTSYLNLLKMDGLLLAHQPLKVRPIYLDKRDTLKKRRGGEQALKKILEESDGGDVKSELRIVVRNISPITTSEDVLEYMEQAGKVVRCWIPNEKTDRKFSLAHVVMANREGKRKALALVDPILKGTDLKIEPFCKGKTKEKVLITQAWVKQSEVLVVWNLPPKCTFEDLWWHFMRAGSIEEIRFPVNDRLNIAYIKMADIYGFMKALHLEKTFMGKYCINTMPTMKGYVPHEWLNIKAQQKGMKE